jgi:hypothetical protein
MPGDRGSDVHSFAPGCAARGGPIGTVCET